MPPRRRAKPQQAKDGPETANTDKASSGGADVEMAGATDRATTAPTTTDEKVPRSVGTEIAGSPAGAAEVLDTDLVTQLQEDLALVCEHLFVGIGSLQRDARPLPLEDEEVVGGPPGATINPSRHGGGPGGRNAVDGPNHLAHGSGAVQSDKYLRGEDDGDIESRAKRMGKDLAESLERLERHIHMLPDGITYDTSMRRGGAGLESAEVRALLEENRALREELEGVVKERTEEVRMLEEQHRLAVELWLQARHGDGCASNL